MTKDSKLPEIHQEAFTKAREKLGLSVKDLGGMACLSARQIEQIENGEASSYYGAQNKFTAAKKVAKLLGLSEEEAFDWGLQPANTSVTKTESIQSETTQSISAQEKESVSDAPKKAAPKKSAVKKEANKVIEQIEETQLSLPAAEEEKQPVKQEPVKAALKEVSFASSSSSAKPAKQKKLLLLLSVIAAAAFAVINLRPMFFADQPAEIIVVKEEIIEPAPAPAAAPVEPAPAAVVPVVNAEVSVACPAEEGIISYKPDAPRKIADSVFVQAKSKQVICVIDATGKTQNKVVEPGVGTSFFGKPPFKVLTPGLAQVDVFFQGAKVRPANLNSKTLILEAAEVVTAPVEKTDSGLR